jgi:hypothetical protein
VLPGKKEAELVATSVNLPLGCWIANSFRFGMLYLGGADTVHVTIMDANGTASSHAAYRVPSVYSMEHRACVEAMTRLFRRFSYIFVVGALPPGLKTANLPFGSDGFLPKQHSQQRDFWTSITLASAVRRMINCTSVFAHMLAQIHRDVAPKSRLLFGNDKYVQSAAGLRLVSTVIGAADARPASAGAGGDQLVPG